MIATVKNFSTLRVLPALFFSVLVTGCQNPLGGSANLSHVDTNYGGTPPTATATPIPGTPGYEAVSAGGFSQKTVSQNHKVDYSVGTPATQMKLTTDKNRSVYLSVQGQINSK